jgi:phage terminase small subunit
MSDAPGARPLTPRQQRFVEEYLIDLNGAQAAIRAGYSSRTAKVIASQLLTKLNVRAALAAADTERRARTGVTPERVLKDIDTAANLDIALLFDQHGRLKPIHELPIEVRRAAESVKVVRRNLTAGDGTQEYVFEVKLVSKSKMQELLAKHTGLVDGEPLEKPQPVPAFVFSDCPGINVH